MSILARFSSGLRAYPYRERLPMIVTILIVMAVSRADYRRPLTSRDVAFGAALLLVPFCGPKGRPFWFFVGMAVGEAIILLVR
jgi:hypothetical protein